MRFDIIFKVSFIIFYLLSCLLRLKTTALLLTAILLPCYDHQNHSELHGKQTLLFIILEQNFTIFLSFSALQ